MSSTWFPLLWGLLRGDWQSGEKCRDKHRYLPTQTHTCTLKHQLYMSWVLWFIPIVSTVLIYRRFNVSDPTEIWSHLMPVCGEFPQTWASPVESNSSIPYVKIKAQPYFITPASISIIKPFHVVSSNFSVLHKQQPTPARTPDHFDNANRCMHLPLQNCLVWHLTYIFLQVSSVPKILAFRYVVCVQTVPVLQKIHL